VIFFQILFNKARIKVDKKVAAIGFEPKEFEKKRVLILFLCWITRVLIFIFYEKFTALPEKNTNND